MSASFTNSRESDPLQASLSNQKTENEHLKAMLELKDAELREAELQHQEEVDTLKQRLRVYQGQLEKELESKDAMLASTIDENDHLEVITRGSINSKKTTEAKPSKKERKSTPPSRDAKKGADDDAKPARMVKIQKRRESIKKERTTTPTSRKKETSGGSAATKDSKEMPKWQKRALERKKKAEAEKAVARSMSSSRLDKSHRLGQMSPTNSLTTSTRSPISGRRSAEMKKSDSTTTSESGTRSLRMRYGRNAEEKAGLSKSVEVGSRVKSLRADSKDIVQTDSPKCSIELASSIDSEILRTTLRAAQTLPRNQSAKNQKYKMIKIQTQARGNACKLLHCSPINHHQGEVLARATLLRLTPKVPKHKLSIHPQFRLLLVPLHPVSGSGPKVSSDDSIPEWKKKLLEKKSGPMSPTRTKTVAKEPKSPAWKKELMPKKANKPDDKVGMCCMTLRKVI